MYKSRAMRNLGLTIIYATWILTVFLSYWISTLFNNLPPFGR
jgi:hypothetical protein